MPTAVAPFVAAPPAFDPVVAAGIGGLAVLMALTALAVVFRWQAAPRGPAVAAVAAWMAVTAAAARSGHLARFDLTPPPMAVLVLSVFTLAFALGLGPVGTRLAHVVPLATLIGLQAFRLPLELVMHRAATLGIMPAEMSYSGYNFDIVTGAGALLLALAMRNGVAVPRAAVWAWNLWGLWCLAVIAVVAVGSSPMVRAFGDDPRHLNTWVLHFPYVWLPAVLVTLALAGHIVVAKALRRDWRGLTASRPHSYTAPVR
ncbi:MAG: hypothetical protein AB7H93_19900 [Vicinamibacterales bacterium]